MEKERAMLSCEGGRGMWSAEKQVSDQVLNDMLLLFGVDVRPTTPNKLTSQMKVGEMPKLKMKIPAPLALVPLKG